MNNQRVRVGEGCADYIPEGIRTDKQHEQHNQDIKHIKDILAAAVLNLIGYTYFIPLSHCLASLPQTGFTQPAGNRVGHDNQNKIDDGVEQTDCRRIGILPIYKTKTVYIG